MTSGNFSKPGLYPFSSKYLTAVPASGEPEVDEDFDSSFFAKSFLTHPSASHSTKTKLDQTAHPRIQVHTRVIAKSLDVLGDSCSVNGMRISNHYSPDLKVQIRTFLTYSYDAVINDDKVDGNFP